MSKTQDQMREDLVKALEGGFDSLMLTGSLLEIFGAATAEVFRARELHGDQTDLPLGTGPDRKSWVDDLIDSEPLHFAADWTNQTTADVARIRCQAAAATPEGDTWEKIITEEYAELLAESDPEKIEVEAIQTIAMLANLILAARKTKV